MTSKFKLSGTASKNLQKTFSGLFAVVDIGIKMVGGFFKLLSPLIGVVKDLADWVLNLTGGWGDWVTGLDKVLDKTDVFNALASTMADAMKSAYEAIKNFFKEIVGVPDFSSLTGLKDTLLSGVEAFFSWVAGIKNVKDESTKFTESIGLLKSSAETALGGIPESLKQ